MQGTYQKVLYYGLLTLFVWPMPFFVAFDLPRTWPTFYSFWGITAAMLPAFFGGECITPCTGEKLEMAQMMLIVGYSVLY